MGFTDLFKSSKEIEREKQRQRRIAEREAERAVNRVANSIAKLKKERDMSKNEARTYLREGQKFAAKRCLQTAYATEVMIGNLECKKWVFNHLCTKIEISSTSQELANALVRLKDASTFDPISIDGILNDPDLTDAGRELDKIWNEKFKDEMSGYEQMDTVQSVDEMMANLEQEVAAEVSGKKTMATGMKTSSSHIAANPLAGEIGAGRRRLTALMDGKK